VFQTVRRESKKESMQSNHCHFNQYFHWQSLFPKLFATATVALHALSRVSIGES
jgi:hypothetical protein